MVAVFVRMVVLVVGEADRIKNQMVVNMSLVNMGGKYKNARGYRVAHSGRNHATDGKE